MEWVMELATIIVNVAATALLWRHVAKPAPVVTVSRTDESAAPKWGTRARKEWHREQRDYHANMVPLAGEAVNLQREFGPKDS